MILESSIGAAKQPKSEEQDPLSVGCEKLKLAIHEWGEQFVHYTMHCEVSQVYIAITLYMVISLL